MAANLTCDYFATNSNIKEKGLEICQGIVAGNVKLINIVESLSSVLTTEDIAIRRKGVEFLSIIIKELPNDFLNEKELTFLTEFFCNKLKDHHSMTSDVFCGSLALVNASYINGICVSNILHNLFQHVTLQSNNPEDRHKFYNILKTCSERHIKVVQDTAPDFLYGAIAAIEGETDPKNLLLIFSFLPSLLSQLHVPHLTGDVFEVLSTYFPVDFTSVEKDNVVITRDDLAVGLCRCLTSTPDLSAECIQLILEKLSSTFKTAKIDSYILLQQCCQVVSAIQIQSHLNVLWKALERDVFPPLHPAIHEEALKALTEVVGVVSKNDEDKKLLDQLLDDIFIGVRSFLAKPGDSLFLPAMQILEATCPKSKVATKRVFLELDSLCKLRTYSDVELLSLLSAILPFLKFHVESNEALQTISTLCLESLAHSQDGVRTIAASALQMLFPYLAKYEKLRTEIYGSLNYVFCHHWKSRSGEECVKLLRLTAEAFPAEILMHILIKFYESLKSGEAVIELFMMLCGALVDIPILTSKIVSYYISFLKAEENFVPATNSLLKACQRTEHSDFLQSLFDEYNVLSLIIASSINEKDLEKLSASSLLVQVIVRSLSITLQDQVVKKTLDCPTEYQLLEQLSSDEDGANGKEILIFEAILGSLRNELSLVPYFEQLLPILKNYAVAHSLDDVRLSAGRLLAAFVNKAEDTIAKQLLNNVGSSIFDNLTDIADHHVALFCWLLKGALLRGLPELDLWIQRWFSLLTVPSLSRQAAFGTKLLLQEETNFLTTKCHCVIKYLYRQRLFCYFPKIVESLPKLSTPEKDSYILTLITLARNAPKEALHSEESSVSIAIAQATFSTDLEILTPTLSLLKDILEDKSEIFTNNITTLIPALLKLTTYSSSLQIRKSALQCLFLAGFYPTHVTLPFKTEVIKALVPCLDDKKRIVRSEAVLARSRWFLIGAVGEDSSFPS